MDKDYWEGRLAGGPDLGNVGYLGLGRAYNRWMYRVRAQVFGRTVNGLGLNLASASILDIGSGSGFYIDRWRRLGASRITGSDLTEVALKSLKARFPGIPFAQLDIAAPLTAFQRESFDVISAMDVLYHITDDASYDRALANLSQLLRPGGFLLFSENFVHGPSIRGEHQVSRSLAQILPSLERLHVIERRPMFVLMNFPIDIRSQSLQLLWRRFSRVLGVHEAIGFMTGALLWPLESLLVRLCAEGPSTELIICQRVA